MGRYNVTLCIRVNFFSQHEYLHDERVHNSLVYLPTCKTIFIGENFPLLPHRYHPSFRDFFIFSFARGYCRTQYYTCTPAY